jgi:hypothetical protein
VLYVQNEITGIIAPKGTGKSFFAAQLFREARPVAVFDTLCEQTYVPYTEELIIGSPRNFAKALNPQCKIVYRPITAPETDLDGAEHDEFHFFALAVYQHGDLTCIVEEADTFCNPGWAHEDFDRLRRIGRHKRVSLIYICRNWSEINRKLTASTNTFHFFTCFEPRDIEGISQRCGPEVAGRVQGLRKLTVSKDGTVIPGERLTWHDSGQYEIDGKGISSPELEESSQDPVNDDNEVSNEHTDTR